MHYQVRGFPLAALLSGLPAVVCGLMWAPAAKAQDLVPKGPIYHDGWIDLNKNGKEDVYEDPTQPVDARIEDLLRQMTLDEKTCQLVTVYGWKRVLRDSLPTADWKHEVWKDGVANIDEQLNGYPYWKGPLGRLPMVWDVGMHDWAMNQVQRFFIEDTRLGIPADFTNEGIRGVEAYMSTGFPTELNMGMTWDTALVHQEGEITGQEGRALGYTNVYAPLLDVARDQRWGRLEEVYGEDPYLVARLGVAMVTGMQDHFQVAATAKHFAFYSANKGAREGMARTDPQVAPREAEDVLLYSFKTVIREAGLLGVMAAYNDYDGIPIIGSRYWLIDRLRRDFGFKGYVVSDSDALEYLFRKHHTAKNLEEAVLQAYMAGLNVRTTFNKPDSIVYYQRDLVKRGIMPMDTLDNRVRDVLRVKFLVGAFDHPYVKDTVAARAVVGSPEHLAAALQASRESIVLLKNEGHVLPLKVEDPGGFENGIAVIGPNATDDSYAHNHYGPLGSASVNVLQGIEHFVQGRALVFYAKGCDLVDPHWPESEVLPEDPTPAEQARIDSAANLAAACEMTIVVLGGNSKTAGENKSRTSLDLPGFQLRLVQAVAEKAKKVVVVLIGSQPMTINWINRHIPGIIYAGYPGMQGGTAIAEVLFGAYDPGGKLTLTWPRSVGQLPYNFPSKPDAESDQGEEAKIKGLLYPFGFGLSYTTFSYSNLTVQPDMVTFDVTNTGTMEGDEVVQMYTRADVSSVTTYEKNLRGFERVHLKPGETRTVQFPIKPEDLMIWNREWKHVVEPGTYTVMVGASSSDIRLKGSFTIQGANPSLQPPRL